MPLYEYICDNCNKRFSVRLSYEDYGKQNVLCTYCRSNQVRRKITRFRLKRSEASRMAEMPDPANLEGIEQDPQSFGKMIRSMSRETGEDLGPEFDEVVDRLEFGQNPNEIEQALPDLDEVTDSTGDVALD